MDNSTTAETRLDLLKKPQKHKKITPKRYLSKAQGLKNHLKQNQVNKILFFDTPDPEGARHVA